MKKSGVLSGDSVRNDLLNSNLSLFSGKTNPALLKIIKAQLPLLSFAVVLDWIPEQGEDIYCILIDNENIATISVPRMENEPMEFEILPLTLYRKNLTATMKRKLAVALDLMHEARLTRAE